MNFDEQKIIEVAQPYFVSARAGDWEHAGRVVKWVKEIGQGRDDLYLIVVAAYIHDIGWSGVAPKGKIDDLDKMLALEPQANANSARLVSEVLLKLKFTDEEIKTVNRLVAAADKHRSNMDDEEIIVDADSLSKLCIEHMQEKYEIQSFTRFLKLWKDELPSRIRTQKGKELFPRLLQELEDKLSLEMKPFKIK